LKEGVLPARSFLAVTIGTGAIEITAFPGSPLLGPPTRSPWLPPLGVCEGGYRFCVEMIVVNSTKIEQLVIVRRNTVINMVSAPLRNLRRSRGCFPPIDWRRSSHEIAYPSPPMRLRRDSAGAALQCQRQV